MTIRKYLHSCILIEEDGFRLLIDPGKYSFIEGTLRPEDIPAPDVILITHEHADHYDVEAIEKIAAPKNAELVVPNHFSGEEPRGLQVTRVDDTDEFQRGPFNIRPIDAPHEAVLSEAPANIGYLINDRILHPGDSLRPNIQQVEILLLPTAAPWGTNRQYIELADRLQPKLAIPIHDAILKDFALESSYERNFRPTLSKLGIEFRPLALGESLEVEA